MADLPQLVVVLGPTGSGKSDLALNLAEKVNGEIVNCDSVQLYRYLDIGTAKVPMSERRGIPHHLIDILNPDEHFTAGDYARTARPLLSEIVSRGHVPIVVGGTGFYLRALLDGLSASPVRDTQLRDRLAQRRPGSLHTLLRRFDPVAAGRIHPNDINKLIRAVEICLLARRPMTRIFDENPVRGLEGFRVLKVGLDPDRDALNERLNLRCSRMFEAGLREEVMHVLDLGYGPESKALQSIGYREAVRLVQGIYSKDQAVSATQTATRQYAKRQRTWFRREREVLWIPAFGNASFALDLAHQHLAAD